jgi:hypothetical protein
MAVEQIVAQRGFDILSRGLFCLNTVAQMLWLQPPKQQTRPHRLPSVLQSRLVCVMINLTFLLQMDKVLLHTLQL